jgi:nucleotide-binding universal stress UspA family protein
VSAERRIVVGVHGSLGSLQALRFATEEARRREARLIPVIAWVPPGGDLAERRQPVYSLREMWREAAHGRLQDAFDRGLGGAPADLAVEPMVVRGPAGPVLVSAAAGLDDLLVVGTGRRGPLRHFRRSVSRYCLGHAHCPVVAIPPSELMQEASRGRRLWPHRDGSPVLGHPDAWLRRTSSG